jgi:leucyl-tRNA synthetase
MILGTDGEKMSKSSGNVISPDTYDPQLLRMYLMFINHYFDGGKWQDNGYKGCSRFRVKFLNWLGQTNSTGMSDFENVFDEFKNKIFNYFDSWKVNKVVSEWMIFYNTYQSFNLNKEQAIELNNFFNACF